MQLSPTEVDDYITYQIGALQGFAHAAGLRLHHVKLHGELAIQCNRDEPSARAYVAAVASFGGELPIYANRHSQVWTAADRMGVRAVAEFYADLPLCQDGRRVPPTEQRRHGRHPDATPEFVRARVRDFLETGSVDAFDGGRVAVEAGTISVHTDERSTIDIVRALRAGIEDANVELSANLS
jgi:5-oxoprolinase (ATP-hydrolysing) subunit A